MVDLEKISFPSSHPPNTMNTDTVVALAQAEIEVKLELQVGARLTENAIQRSEEISSQNCRASTEKDSLGEKPGSKQNMSVTVIAGKEDDKRPSVFCAVPKSRRRGTAPRM